VLLHVFKSHPEKPGCLDKEAEVTDLKQSHRQPKERTHISGCVRNGGHDPTQTPKHADNDNRVRFAGLTERSPEGDKDLIEEIIINMTNGERSEDNEGPSLDGRGLLESSRRDETHPSSPPDVQQT
jgi:hypothetical protein